MTHVRIVLWLLCLLGLTSAARSQATPGTAEPQHIAIVNFNAAVLQTAEAQKRLKALQDQFAPKQQQLQSLDNEVETLRKQIAGSSGTLTDAERATRAQTLESKEKQLQRAAEDFKSDSQAQSEEIFQQVAQKVFGFLQTFSQQHGYSVVIERGSETYPVVWYTAKDLDITGQLVKAYNAQSESKSLGPPNSPVPGNH